MGQRARDETPFPGCDRLLETTACGLARSTRRHPLAARGDAARIAGAPPARRRLAGAGYRRGRDGRRTRCGRRRRHRLLHCRRRMLGLPDRGCRDIRRGRGACGEQQERGEARAREHARSIAPIGFVRAAGGWPRQPRAAAKSSCRRPNPAQILTQDHMRKVTRHTRDEPPGGDQKARSHADLCTGAPRARCQYRSRWRPCWALLLGRRVWRVCWGGAAGGGGGAGRAHGAAVVVARASSRSSSLGISTWSSSVASRSAW